MYYSYIISDPSGQVKSPTSKVGVNYGGDGGTSPGGKRLLEKYLVLGGVCSWA